MTKPTIIEGVYQASGRGFGFVTPDGAEGREEDLFIPPRREGGAWHGDRVRVSVCADDGGESGRTVGRVTAVLQRNNPTVIGRLSKEGRDYWLQPDNSRLTQSIRLTGSRSGLRAGDKAEVRVVSYGTAQSGPLGLFLRAFGRDGTRQAAVEAILAQNRIPHAFPRDVLLEAGQIPSQVPPHALEGRLDLRDKQIITIDGPTAKDLDDAVSLERDGKGRWVLGVHIADVSHYVAEGSALDREAFDRGTSVYFADRVIPMLPEALSNGICSLNPQVDRLTLSCLMTLDGQGHVVEHTIAKSVIRTAERMTYPDCNALLGEAPLELSQRYAAILPMLREMEGLASVLRRKRRNRGALDLETGETYILCDEYGFPVDLCRRVPGVSEGIIEEFMLIANETVAEHLVKAAKPGVFRVHEKPAPARLEQLRTTLAPFGYTLPTPDAFGMQKLLQQAEGRPEQGAVSLLVLRSLMKARYASENLGHFGLGAEFYCHFTSPIRRYPDLMVHRVLSALLCGASQGEERALSAACTAAAQQSTQREEAAETAERDIEKCYQAEYMHGHLGETYPAMVSGVTRFGLFVLLPNGVEGLVPLEALPDDDYCFDEDKLTLTGTRAGRVFSLSAPLTVRCVAADAGAGQVTFYPEGMPDPPAQPASLPKDKPRGRKPTPRKRPMHAPKRRRRR